MHRNTWSLLLGSIVLGLAVTVLLAQQIHSKNYAPGPLPVIGDIQSMCVETAPAPQTRTTVGIGEKVRCWIDAGTWQDIDICRDADGNQSEVSDPLGMVVWSVNGLGTVYPIVTDGSAVTLTIDLAAYDGIATVTATVTDSRTLGDDPPIQMRKIFDVKTPSGVQALQAADQPPVEKPRDDK
jgi:hypothetical protein